MYDPGQAGQDAYQDPAHNTHSKECLYAWSRLDVISATDARIPPKQDEKFPYKHFIPSSRDKKFPHKHFILARLDEFFPFEHA
jgi:hypothetical protein